MKLLSLLIACLTMISTNPADAFEIKRFYRSSEDHYRIIVETDKKIRVKCIVYDKEEEPLSVDEQTVKPPLSEVIIRVITDNHNNVGSVNCINLE